MTQLNLKIKSCHFPLPRMSLWHRLEICLNRIHYHEKNSFTCHSTDHADTLSKPCQIIIGLQRCLELVMLLVLCLPLPPPPYWTKKPNPQPCSDFSRVKMFTLNFHFLLGTYLLPPQLAMKRNTVQENLDVSNWGGNVVGGGNSLFPFPFSFIYLSVLLPLLYCRYSGSVITCFFVTASNL